MTTAHPKRVTAFLAVIAAVVVPVLALGIAAPAQALAPAPVAPPKLTLPSSVISGAAGGNATSGAQLAGQVAQGVKGSPAFPAGGLTKVVGGVGQALSNYNLGTFIGGAVDEAFGIDRDGTVCSNTSNDLGGSILRTLSGADCSAYDFPASYTPNGDSVAAAGRTTLTYNGRTVTVLAVRANPYYSNGAPAGSSAYAICTKDTGLSSITTPATGGSRWMWYVNYDASAPNPAVGSTPGSVDAPGWMNVNNEYNGEFPSGQNVCLQSPALAGVNGYFRPATYYSSPPMVQRMVAVLLSSTTKVVSVNGSASAPSGDPTRWLTCTIKTTDGGTYVGTSDTFLESSGKMAPTKCPVIPTDKTAGHMTITLNGGPDVLTLYDQDSTAAYQAAQSAYPACSNGTCTLDLIDGTGSCYQGDPSRCATWMTDPNRDSKYSCKYGTYAVAIKECFALANAFDLAKVAAGQGLADPATGTTPGTQTSTKPDTGGAPDPADGGDQRQACFPTGWGVINPLNWVLQPVKCALNWAFVPRSSVITNQNNNLQTAVRASAVGSIGTILTGIAAYAVGDGGCNGVHFDVSIYSARIKGDLLKACPGDPLAAPAALTKTIITAVISTLAILACIRYVATIFGFTGFGRAGAGPSGPRFGPAPESSASSEPYYVVYESGRGGGIDGSSRKGIGS